MTGFLLIGALLLWVWLCRMGSHAVTDRLFSGHPHRLLIDRMMFLLLLPLILLDEIIAAPQFFVLCREQAVLVRDATDLASRRVRYSGVTSRVGPVWPLDSTIRKWSFVDAATGTPLFHYQTVEVEGGIFVRALGVFEGNGPLLFCSGLCAPSESSELRKWIALNGMVEERD